MSKFDKLKQLRGVENKVTTAYPVVNELNNQENHKVENVSEPTVNLKSSELTDIIAAKVEAKALKDKTVLRKKSKTPSDYSQTKVSQSIFMEVGWRLKKEKILIQDMNDVLYQKLLSDKEFFSDMVKLVRLGYDIK